MTGKPVLQKWNLTRMFTPFIESDEPRSNVTRAMFDARRATFGAGRAAFEAGICPSIRRDQ
jgi:hypothetical protein